MDIAPLTLNQVLSSSSLKAMREAAATCLRRRYPFCEVKSHPGKLDLAELVKGDLIKPPGILLAVSKVDEVDRLSHSMHLVLQLTAYLVVEPKSDAGGKLVTMDEVGLALMRSLIADLRDDAFARWGLENISYPEKIEGRPLLTAALWEKRTGYYTVQWSQELVNQGAPADYAAQAWSNE